MTRSVLKHLGSPTMVALLVLVSLNATLAFLNVRQQRNQEAISYICDTTTVLDALVVTAAEQIDANFKNGTYRKLRQQGLLSAENVQAARKTLVKYRAAHRQLEANGACI